MYTMGDVARGSVGKPGAYHNEELLYRLSGINAELSIDLAWGYEPCRMEHHQGIPDGKQQCPVPDRCCTVLTRQQMPPGGEGDDTADGRKQELDEYEKAALDEQLHELDVQLRSEILSGTQSAEPQAACAQTAGVEPQPGSSSPISSGRLQRRWCRWMIY